MGINGSLMEGLSTSPVAFKIRRTHFCQTAWRATNDGHIYVCEANADYWNEAAFIQSFRKFSSCHAIPKLLIGCHCMSLVHITERTFVCDVPLHLNENASPGNETI